MNKIMMVAAVTASAFATYLLLKRRAHDAATEPTEKPAQPDGKHVTNVFAKAKKYSM